MCDYSFKDCNNSPTAIFSEAVWFLKEVAQKRTISPAGALEL